MNAAKQQSHKQSQRERILEAATRCFIQHGFHSASMATISETAEMSPGLIYRYFDSKNEIILAIVEAQLEVVKRRLCALHNTEALAEAMLEYFESHDQEPYGSASAPLFLEITAAATRDPDIAKAVSRIDSTVRIALAEWFHRSREEGGYGLPDDVAEEAAVALVLLADGLKARKARDPNLDRRVLKNAINRMVGAITGATGAAK